MRLICKGRNDWAIQEDHSDEPFLFSSVDDACDYLIDIYGLSEDDVDSALISMHTNNHNSALFSASAIAYGSESTFLYTEDV